MKNTTNYNDVLETNLILETEDFLKAEEIINDINYLRLKILGFGVVFIEFLLQFVLPRILVMNFDKNIRLLYDFCHRAYLVWGIIVLIVSYKFYKKKNKFLRYFPYLTTFIFTTLSMFIGILDQQNLGKVTSYVTILFAFGVFFLIKPPINYIVFAIPHLLFISILIIKFPLDNAIISTIINTSVFFTCILLISRVFYLNQYTQILNRLVLEKTNEKMSKIIFTDHLTSLYNRRWFEETIKKYESKGVLAIMDLDFFKKINDTFGHHIGDIVLKETALVIQNSLHDLALVARWGGEEFIFYFPNRSLNETTIILNNLKNNISSNKIEVNDIEITITASIGVTEIFLFSEEEYINACKVADEALYKAKENGRNLIVTLSHQDKM